METFARLYKKKKIPARPERADFNSSFIRFVRCCKTSRRWKKKSLCCSFQASKKNLSSHFEWMDTSTRPSLREEMRNKERKMEFTTLHLLAKK